DLQEPLRNIAIFSQLLARRYAGKLDAEADGFIGIITSSVTHMHALINGLLAYSRVNSFDPAGMSSVDLNKVLERARTNLTAKLAETGTRIEAEPLPTVLGDEIQIVQVFQNLIDN